MRIILIGFLLSISTAVCCQEIDDMYFSKKDRGTDTVKIYKRKRSYSYNNPNYNLNNWRPHSYDFWYRDYYYPYEFYRNRTIVIVPNNNNFNYGKRPSRETQPQIKSNSPRRGRE